MKIGMLWFDNDPKDDLSTKITRAADYYAGKYGKRPTACFVHPSMLKPDTKTPDGIEIKTTRSVLPSHFWLGVEA